MLFDDISFLRLISVKVQRICSNCKAAASLGPYDRKQRRLMALIKSELSAGEDKPQRLTNNNNNKCLGRGTY